MSRQLNNYFEFISSFIAKIYEKVFQEHLSMFQRLLLKLFDQMY